MPKGCFLIIIEKNSELKVLGYYYKDKKEETKISQDLLLRIQMNHSSKEVSKVNFGEIVYFSVIHEFPVKSKYKIQAVILGIFLSEEEDAKSYVPSLQNAAKSMDDLGEYDIETLDIEKIIEDSYKKYIEKLKDIFDPEILKNNIIEKTKEMLGGSNKDRKKAQEMLKKIEEGIHTKIFKSGKAAENAMKTKDYEKAVKEYDKSAKLAIEIEEKSLADSFKERASVAKQVPSLTKERDEIVMKARNSLRNDDFHSAYVSYREAADLSEKLMEFEKTEEYSLKSKALADFHQADKKYKKK